MTRISFRLAPAAAAVLLVTVACDNAGSTLFPQISEVGLVEIQVYLDRDGSQHLNGADTAFAGAKVELRPPNGGAVIRSINTGPLGAFLEGVNVGDYSITVDPASIGDSLVVGEIDPPQIRVQAGGEPPLLSIRLEYPTLSIRQARQQPAGKRIMIRGLVLSGVQNFRDTTSHVRDTSVAIRLTQAFLRFGGAGNDPGDSVTVLGTVSSRAGQPTLDEALITRFSTRPPPVATTLTAAVAATAQGGALDAGLVLVSNLVISQSGAQAPDFRIVASDGTGPITILVDDFIPIDPTAFSVGRTISIRGVLVPEGPGKWQLKPRDNNDITIF